MIATAATLVPLLIVGVLLLYLAIRTTKQVSSSLGQQIMLHATARVEMSVRDYLHHAERASDVFADLLLMKVLPETNLEPWRLEMLSQLRTTPEVAAIGFANANDDYVYLMRFPPELEFGVGKGAAEGTTMRSFAAYLDGRLGPPARDDRTFKVRNRPWYQFAMTHDGPTWTPAYTWFTTEDRPPGLVEFSVAFTRTIYEPQTHRFLGVLSVDTLLTQVHTMLRDLAQPMQSVVLITDEEGVLIGSSHLGEGLATLPPGRRIQDINNPVTHAVADAISSRGAVALRQPIPIHITAAGQTYWVGQSELSLGPGTHWFCTIAIPEQSILAEAERSGRWIVTIGTVYITFAGIVSVLLARLLTEPMRRLAVFAQTVGEGNFDRRVDIRTTREMVELSEALNGMTIRLRDRVSLLAQRDAAEQATSVKSRLIAHVSHEFRTPLNAIIGYAELLRDSTAADRRARDVSDASNILTASQHLLRLVDNLLDLSSIEAGRLRLEIIDFSIVELLNSAAVTSRPAVERHGNRLEIEPPRPDARMTSDPARITQVLINLLANAGKFTDHGVVTLAATVDGVNKSVRFTVLDTGSGILPEQVARMFEPFVQLEPPNPSVARRVGAGLGLAISRQLCRALGGDITVESTVRRGTRMTVTLPLHFEGKTASGELPSGSGGDQ